MALRTVLSAALKKLNSTCLAIQDRFEAAEFYYKTAGAYYMMKSPALSIQYVNKALEIYQGEFGYIKKRSAA